MDQVPDQKPGAIPDSADILYTEEIENEMKMEYDALEKKTPELEYTFAATLGWYYTYVEQDAERVDRWMKKAKAYAEQIYLCDLDLIDYYYIPHANMKLECRREIDRSAALLLQAQELCDLHADMPVYQRKKEEVQGYLDSLEDMR